MYQGKPFFPLNIVLLKCISFVGLAASIICSLLLTATEHSRTEDRQFRLYFVLKDFC